MLLVDNRIQGYACIPHEKQSVSLVDSWKKSVNITNVYFVTATFSDESLRYFPNIANHYLLAGFMDIKQILQDFPNRNAGRLSFIFNLNGELFERSAQKINYISLYFTKNIFRELEIIDLANVIAKRERVKKASLANIQFFTTEQLKFTFPYTTNLIVLEVEGEKTHQSDHKYCERTRRDVMRRGISLNNLVSLSILEKLK